MTQFDARTFPFSFIFAPVSVSQTFGIVAVLGLNFTMLRHHKAPKITTQGKFTRSEPSSVSHGRAFFRGKQQR
jgi:hypothetical protein